VKCKTTWLLIKEKFTYFLDQAQNLIPRGQLNVSRNTTSRPPPIELINFSLHLPQVLVGKLLCRVVNIIDMEAVGDTPVGHVLVVYVYDDRVV
jgi:hypothetical protein